MKSDDETGSRLDKQIGRMIEKNPHCQNILNAFKPVILKRKHLVEDDIRINADVSEIDKIRLKGGIPVCRQAALLSPDEPWNEIASAMNAAITEGFPELADELQKIEDGIEKGSVRLTDYYTSFPELDEEIVRNWITTLNIRPEPLYLLLICVLRTALEIKAGKVVEQIGDLSWDKGYCPICGAYPDIAVIKDKITQRWLHCSRCRYEWRFNRVLCPYCEHEGKEEGTTYFYVDGKEQETAFICEKCERYVLTLNRISDLDDPDFDVLSMGLTHLDVIMQEKGYIPLTFNEWNDFRARP